MKIYLILVAMCLAQVKDASAQLFDTKKEFSRADTLRGSITAGRAWWDAIHYDIHAEFNAENQTMKGVHNLTYKVLEPNVTMQLDLQQPLQVKRIEQDGEELAFTREGNVIWVELKKPQVASQIEVIQITYAGKPQIARMPPWDGGLIWSKDKSGNPWISIACQGLGASVWYPNKDHQSDEPDSARLHITVPGGMVVIGNGRKADFTDNQNGTVTWVYRIENPINNYNIIPYIGKYEIYDTVYQGLSGPLDVSMCFLEGNMPLAKSHVLPDIWRTLEAFEYWFGPFPFYEDGFKMVHAPHLGMEHQSAIAYGNEFKKGYLGQDLSGTGIGKDWDYIVVHESGHEWFGNNITTKDIADMWVHEGFTDYSEALFVEYWYGKPAADTYVQGLRRKISNDVPVIGPYLVNQEGSGDMYYKGANLIHTIRSVIDNDSLFRQMLIGLNTTFRHQTVTSRQVEEYMSQFAGIDLSRIFAQYLRTTHIPVLDQRYSREGGKYYLQYRWGNIVKGFNMPVDLQIGPGKLRLYPTSEWATIELPEGIDIKKDIRVDPNFYILQQVSKP